MKVPKAQVNAILRSGKDLPNPYGKDAEEQIEQATSRSKGAGHIDEEKLADHGDAQEEHELRTKNESTKEKPTEVWRVTYFPDRLKRNKKEREDNDILNLVSKVEINIPFLEALKQVSRYAKFMKELWFKKVRFEEETQFVAGKNARTHPGMFFIPCVIGNI